MLRFKIKAALAAGVALCAVTAGGAHAASSSYSTPNVITTAGATQVTLGGKTFCRGRFFFFTVICTSDVTRFPEQTFCACR